MSDWRTYQSENGLSLDLAMRLLDAHAPQRSSPMIQVERIRAWVVDRLAPVR